MDGTVITSVKYREGHSRLGTRSLIVQIIAYSTNLTVNDSNGNALFSVPWENFQDVRTGVVFKNDLELLGASFIAQIPVWNWFGGTSSFVDGFYLSYWDNDIQRRQDVFFATGRNNAERVVTKIFQFRDQYFSQTRHMSGPQHR